MLVPVPLIDQRSQTGLDGRAPEDGNQDCVPASLAAMCAGLTGRPQNADDWHDRVYGQGYIGLQDPARYVALARSRGMALQYVDRGGGAADVAFTVAQLAAGRTVLLAIPSDWGDEPPTSPYAHMVAACDVSADGQQITAMNPWGGFYQTQSATWWAERLDHCSGYRGIWIGAPAAPEGLDVWTKTVNSQGFITGAHDDKGHEIGPGLYSVLAAQGWLSQDALYAAYPGGGWEAVILDDGHGQPANGAEWLAGAPWPSPQRAGLAYTALRALQERDAALAELVQLKNQLATLQAQNTAEEAGETSGGPPADPTAEPLRMAFAAFMAYHQASQANTGV